MENSQTSSQTTSRQRHSHLLVWVGLLTGLLLVAACQPIQDPALLAGQPSATEAATPAATEEAAEEVVTGVEPAAATIAADSLRVRALPNDDAEVVAGVTAGDTFTVTGISSDGAWIQIEIEESPDGLGWVSAEFVTLAGDITAIAVVEVEGAEATDEATTEATEEAAEEATTEVTDEATAEATPEPTEEATPEATPEATVQATAEVTETATAEPTVEATAVVTAEATTEATVEATEVATDTVTVEATEEATPEATEEATDEGASTDLGTVTIVAVPPLRVRSEPTAEVENKIGNVFDGEVYTVLEVTEDGLWVRIETPQFPEGSGWVSAEFVLFNEAE